MKKEKKSLVKRIPYIDYACKKGERVQWSNLKGEHLEGVIVAWLENDVAVVQLDDGPNIEVQC